MAVDAVEPSTAVLELTGERTPIRDLLADYVRRISLLQMLAARDFRSRYRSTRLGLVWAVLLPLIQGSILAIVFTHLVRVQTSADYPVFVLVGMTTWTYITTAVNNATTSIVDQADVAGRVYFPRLFLPGVPILAGVPGLMAGLLVIVPIGAILGVDPTWHLVAYPLVAVLAAATAYAVGSLLALLNVYFRDIKYFVVAALQALLYASPIIYPLTLIPSHRLRTIAEINPGAGVIELARWSFAANGTDPLALPVLSAVAWSVVLSIGAIFAYSKFERLACDRL
ncbi:MAG TPA: ABC transporter permease [Mycobacteriales bacterium]|nr:ABC transporter permease [Mycobacteriales bacterium]